MITVFVIFCNSQSFLELPNVGLFHVHEQVNPILKNAFETITRPFVGKVFV